MWVALDKETNTKIIWRSDVNISFDFWSNLANDIYTIVQCEIIPEYWKYENNNIVEMSFEDKINFGIITIDETQRLSDDKQSIIEKTLEEKLISNLITKQEYDEKKLLRLRDVRDAIFQNTGWIQEYISSEREAIAIGVITEQQMTWPTFKRLEYLQWKQILRDLPETVILDDYTYEEIIVSNTNIFPICPMDTRLTPIGPL